MRFGHIADCHLGCWRQPELQALNLEAFERAIESCIAEKVDFVLISGDLFDSAIPPVDILKGVAAKLRALKEANIPCYVVHGSHDFSMSGKSMLAVLEKAGLCEDVAGKFVKQESEEGKVLLFGLEGKKGGLEQKEIAKQKAIIDQKISSFKADFSVLLAHTTVSEITTLPATVALSIEELPLADYYALGHIHQNVQRVLGKKVAAYPGTLFPTNFSELETQHSSSFFIVEKENEKIKIKKMGEQIRPIINIIVDANNSDCFTLKERILSQLRNYRNKLKDAVVSLRIAGKLEYGKPSDIDWHAIETEAKAYGIYCLLRHTSKLESKEFELKVKEEITDIDELEHQALEAALSEHLVSEEQKEIVKLLLSSLDMESREGETATNFNSRLIKEIIKTLKLEEVW